MNGYLPWGKSISIDLFDCNFELISQPEPIVRYINEVITVIDMVAHGPCNIERFGSGQLEGYSAMQFIETSSITVHCDEKDKRVFIDIFSCKEFDSSKARRFSQHFFRAKKMKSRSAIR